MEEKFLKLTNTVYKVLEFFPESDPLKNRAKDKVLAIMENLLLINETSGWASFQKEKIKVQLLEDIDILLGYLWIGKSQGWLNSSNCLIISNEYEKIKKGVDPIIELELTQRLPLPPTNFEVKEKETSMTEKSSKLVGGELDKQFVLQKSAQIDPSPVSESEGFDKEETLNSFVPDNEEPTSAKASARQGKILEFLNNNEKAQVMDLQTILPDITKRTIRRDLDELLESGKIIRLGEFNQVFYKIASD